MPLISETNKKEEKGKRAEACESATGKDKTSWKMK